MDSAGGGLVENLFVILEIDKEETLLVAGQGVFRVQSFYFAFLIRENHFD